jgi:hypothetical protein
VSRLKYVGAVAVGVSMMTLTTAAALFAQSSWDDGQETQGTVRAIFCDIGVAEDDSDADTLTNEAEISLGTNPCSADTDQDGCGDGREVAPKSEAALGGGRDPLDYWDFMDMWANGTRDGVVNIIDISALVFRFGTTGDASGDPLDPPQALTGYHVSADRSSPKPGANLWNAEPPDGAIDIIEIGLAIVQFGHDCSRPL